MSPPAFKFLARSRRFAAGLVCIAALVAGPARAEIAKIMRDCGAKGDMVRLCPFFRPSFKPPPGWIVDEKSGFDKGIDIFLPPGKTFGNAPVLIFGEARPNSGKTPLATWVRVSDERWAKVSNELKVTELPSLDLGAGKREVIVHRYENPALRDQPYEIIGYFAEDDSDGNSFVIRLTLSGFKADELEKARGVFDDLLKNY